MTNIDVEIIRRAKKYNYKKEIIEMSETLRKQIKDLGSDKILELNPNIDGEVFAQNDKEIIDIMSKRLIKYKIKEQAFDRLTTEGLIHPINMCDDTCTINKNFKKADGSSISGKFGFRRIVFNKFITA